MNEKQLLKKILRELKITQTELAKRLGYNAQSGVAQLVGGNHKFLSVPTLVRALDAIGCELVIRSKEDATREWIITAEEESK